MTQGFTNDSAIPVPVTQGGTGRIATTANNILYSSAANVIGQIAPVANGVLAADGSGVPAFTTVPYPRAAGWNAYTGTITLVGGVGNTVPTFSIQSARYSQVGNVVFVNIDFENTAGGTAGAGSGVINIALPVTSGAGNTAGTVGASGTITGLASSYLSFAIVPPSSATFQVNFINGVTSTQSTGATFANATRYIQMQFFYEI